MASASVASMPRPAPCPGDDRREPAGIGPARSARARDVFPRRAVEQLQAALHRVDRIARFYRLRVGGVDEGEPSGRVAHPHRRRQPFDQRAQRGDLGEQRFVAPGKLQQLALDAAQILEAEHGAPRDGAALRLDRRTGERRQRHRKRFAMRTQCVDRVFHRPRFAGIEPAAEGEHAVRRGGADHGGIAFDRGLIRRRRPVDQNLRLGLQQRVGAV
jgi:hypothetical protein